MHRLAKPSDYVLQDLWGATRYVLPWTTAKYCTGNPTSDPVTGAQLYNEHVMQALAEARRPTEHEKVDHIADWCINTSGEAARALAADMAAARAGQFQFTLDCLTHSEGEAMAYRIDLVFIQPYLVGLRAAKLMNLRVRAARH